MAVAFALVPEPTTMGVISGRGRRAESAGLLGTSPKEDRLGSGARRDARAVRERTRPGRRRRAGVLRVAKWGSRTLYRFCLHIGALMCVAKFTDWYEITWHLPETSGGGHREVRVHVRGVLHHDRHLIAAPRRGRSSGCSSQASSSRSAESSRRFELQRERALSVVAHLRTSENRPADHSARARFACRVFASRRSAQVQKSKHAAASSSVYSLRQSGEIPCSSCPRRRRLRA